MTVATGWLRFHDSMDYLFDIHPKTRAQYDYQKFVAGIVPQYGSYMIGKSQTEKGVNTMELYGIEFGDIKYPWLSGLTGGNEVSTAASAGWQFSSNVVSLYKGASRAFDRSKEEKHRKARGRRYHYRHRGW